MLRPAAVVIIATGLFTTAALAGYSVPVSLTLTFDPDRPPPERVVPGFHPPERTREGETFAWTNGQAFIALRELDRGTAWAVQIRLASGAWPPDLDLPAVDLMMDGVTVRRIAAPRSFSDIELVAPPRIGASGLTLAVRSPTFTPGDRDPRPLGVVVQSLMLRSQGRMVMSSRKLAATLAAGAALGAAVVVAGVPAGWVLAILAALGAMTGVLLRTGSAVYESRFSAALTMALWIAAFAGAGAIAARLLRRSLSRPAVLAVGLTLAATYVKLLILFHPDMIVGDTIFHLHRLEWVRSGTYFFTSQAPGGEFPYPVALYGLVGSLGWITSDWVALLRGVVVATDAVASLAVYGMAARTAMGAAAGPWAVALYELIPATFQVHGTAYLTNAFGQALSVIALFSIVRCSEASRRPDEVRQSRGGRAPVPARLAGPVAVTTALVSIALLSHTSSAAILFTTLVTAGFLLRAAGEQAAHSMARVVALSAVLALTISTVVYYGHFGDTYRSMAARLTSPRVAAADAAVPTQRAEAHQTGWAPGWQPFVNRVRAVPGYVDKYLGWSLLLLAALGGWAQVWRRPRDGVTLLVLAWIGTCFVFLLMGLLTPVDMRSYLAVSPALAVLAAVGVRWGWTRGWIARIGVLALFVWCASAGITYWLAWLSPAPPR